MRKILGLSVAALLVMALVGGGTWAFFSDVETSSANTFAGGTLDLGLATAQGQNPTGSITGTFSTSNWAPGSTVNATIYVNNEGSLAMSSVNLTFSYTSVNTSGRPTNISGSPWTTEPTDFFDKMLVATTVTWNSVTDATLQGKTLAQLAALGAHNLGSLPANTEYPLYILWTFNSAATNGCQGNTVDATLTFNGYQ